MGDSEGEKEDEPKVEEEEEELGMESKWFLFFSNTNYILWLGIECFLF